MKKGNLIDSTEQYIAHCVTPTNELTHAIVARYPYVELSEGEPGTIKIFHGDGPAIILLYGTGVGWFKCCLKKMEKHGIDRVAFPFLLFPNWEQYAKVLTETPIKISLSRWGKTNSHNCHTLYH